MIRLACGAACHVCWLMVCLGTGRPVRVGGGMAGPMPTSRERACASGSFPPLLCSNIAAMLGQLAILASHSHEEAVMQDYGDPTASEVGLCCCSGTARNAQGMRRRGHADLSKRDEPEGAIELRLCKLAVVTRYKAPDLRRNRGVIDAEYIER